MLFTICTRDITQEAKESIQTILISTRITYIILSLFYSCSDFKKFSTLLQKVSKYSRIRNDTCELVRTESVAVFRITTGQMIPSQNTYINYSSTRCPTPLRMLTVLWIGTILEMYTNIIGKVEVDLL